MIVSLMSVVFCSSPDHYSTSSKCSGVDINTARLFYHRLIQPDYPQISQIVSHLFLCFQHEWNQCSVIFRRLMLNVLFSGELLLLSAHHSCFNQCMLYPNPDSCQFGEESPPQIEQFSSRHRGFEALPHAARVSAPQQSQQLHHPHYSFRQGHRKPERHSHQSAWYVPSTTRGHLFVGLRHGSCKTLNNIFLVQNQQSNAFLLLSLYKNIRKWNRMNSINMFCIMRWLCTERLYLKWCIFRLSFMNGSANLLLKLF